MHFSTQRGMKFTLLGITSFAALAFSISAQAETHTVQSGDTLSEIAEKNNRTIDYLVAINNLQDPDHIVSGQELELGDGETFPATANAATSTPASVYNYSENTYYGQQSATTNSNATTTPVLPNGNTAGATGSYAASKMAEATGVPASTWEYIIARESNGQVNAYNPSGASGLFQTMPGWGSTATVDDQVQSAIKAYNAQGLSAWGY